MGGLGSTMYVTEKDNINTRKTYSDDKKASGKDRNNGRKRKR